MPPPEPTMARPKLEITWGERNRAVQGPSSALSATITYADSHPDGGDFRFIVDRPDEPQAQTLTYQPPTYVLTGPTTLRITFSAYRNGMGNTVGSVDIPVVVKGDGTLEKPSGGALGSVVTEGRVQGVFIDRNLTVRVGETTKFYYHATDASNQGIMVTPGSYFLSSDSNALQANSDGTVTGKAPGTANLTVTIDGKQATAPVTIEAVESEEAVRYFPLRASKLAYSPLTQRVYAGVADSDPNHANRIVAINPTDASITSSVAIGNNPNTIVIGPDGHTLYVGLKEDGTIRRFDAQTGQAGATFSLGTAGGKPMFADDITVHPTAPGTVAVALARSDESPRHMGVAVFDDGVARPTSYKGVFQNNKLEWSELPNVIYGMNAETSELGIRKFEVTAQGVEQTGSVSNIFTRDGDIIYGGGRIYVENGLVVDAETLKIVGKFPMEEGTRPMAIDFTARRAYAITDQYPSPSMMIRTFDLDTLALLDTKVMQAPIPGRPKDMIVAGSGRLAIRTDAGYVGLIDLSKF